MHEAMHLWENNNPSNLKLVKAFLKSPNGYYGRIAKAEKECPQFNEYNSFTGKEKTFCGYNSISDLRAAYALKYKIPQRYGRNVEKVRLLTDSHSCRVWETKKVTVDNEIYCFPRVSRDYGADEDIHAFRKNQPSEYFAVMVELYLYNRKEYLRVASAEEQLAFQSIINQLKR